MFTFNFLGIEDPVDSLAGFDVNIQSLTLSGIGILAIVMVLTGRLVPKGRVDGELQAKDKTIEVLEGQNENLITTLSATNKLLSTLDENARVRQGADNGTT